MEVTGEMQVHLFHRDDLRIAAPRGPAFHAEIRTKRRLADTDGRVLADAVQPVAQTDGGRGFPLARGCGVDRGDEDQLAIGTVLH